MTAIRRVGSAVQAAGRAWHRFWFIELDPFVFGALRIILGLYLTLYYAMLGPSWLRYYSPSGVVPPAPWPSKPFGPLSISLLQYVTSDWGMWVYYAICLFSAVALLLGRLGKFPIVWLWLSNLAIQNRHLEASNGEEQVLAVLLFYALFLPLNTACRAGRDDPRTVRVWALRLLQVHLALIYAISWPFKIASDPAWRDGTVVYYSMMSMMFARWPGLELFGWHDALVSRLLTYYTLVIELLFPLLVWFRRFRLPVLGGLLALHLGLAVFLRGHMLFNGSIVVGLLSFLPSHWLRRAVGAARYA